MATRTTSGRTTKSASKPAPAADAIRQSRFDARPDRLDFRDRIYTPPLRSLPRIYPAEADVGKYIGGYVDAGLILNQGNQGACTGFGLACVANYLLWSRHVEDQVKVPFLPVSARMLFELAKRYDEWPGIDYDYSSPRGALKGWHKHGVCGEAFWPYALDPQGQPVYVRPRDDWDADAVHRPLGLYFRIDRTSVVDVQSAIVNIGAVYVSATAHDGWDALAEIAVGKPPPTRHAQLPAIAPVRDRRSMGGHAFALVGYNERGFVVQNSWGTRWGASGFAVLPYEDWIVNATDAWACALGVPVAVSGLGDGKAKRIYSTRWRVGSGKSLGSVARDSRQPDNPADDPWPIDHPYDFIAYEPWRTPVAYEHTLVAGNEGELAATDFTRHASDKAGLAADLVRIAPQTWLNAHDDTPVLKVAIYADGGLTGEERSIERVRVMGPCFEANGVYPIFLTWKTGPGETLIDMTQDWARRVAGEEAARSGSILTALGDAKDRAVEAVAHVLGRGVWAEMRENAEASTQAGHGLDLLLRNLVDLQADLVASGRKLELHLVGHSAGSILLGHFVSLLAARKKAGKAALPVVASTSLYAAACSTRFAIETYAAASAAGAFDLASLWLYVLSDANEEADALPTPDHPAYGKSLLYLVSRALDDRRKMPLLGMERTHLPEFATDADQWAVEELSTVQAWQAAWPGAKRNLLSVVDTPEIVTTRAKDHMQSTHGSFDNNIAILTETIERIRGSALVRPLEWLDD